MPPPSELAGDWFPVEPEGTPGATPVATVGSIPPVVVATTNGTSFPWAEVISIVLLSAMLWTGLRKVELSPYVKGIIGLLDLGLLAYGVYNLGWSRGLGLVILANLVFFLISSVRFAVQYDDVLTHASVAAGVSKSEMRSLADRLSQNDRKLFNYMKPMRKATLIRHLSERNRNLSEIEAMAPALPNLWVIGDRPELETFVADFDRLLRLWRKPATNATQVADTITAAYKNSPMTIREVIESLIVVAGGSTDGAPFDYRSTNQSESQP